MDIIYQLLQATLQFDSQIRLSAEQKLKSLETDQGFLIALMDILRANIPDKNVQQAAAIYFKNSIQQGWSKDTISEFDKNTVREHILSLLLSDLHIINIRSQIIAALGSILSHDASSNYCSAFLQQIQTLLASEELNAIHCGLLALSELAKVFQWSSGTKRAPLNFIIDSTYPALLVIATKLLSSHSLQAGEIVKTITKLFCGSIRLELSSTLQQHDILSGWASVFLQIIQKEVLQVENFPANYPEREKYPWIKAKKWSYQSIYHLYCRYSKSLKKDKKYVAFAKSFTDNYVPRILEIYLHELQLIKMGVWTSEKVKNQLGMFFEECVKPKSTWLAIKPHLETIIVNFIFPILCFTESDWELWNEDPVEFINKRVDPPLGDSRSAVTAAEELLCSLIKDRFKQTFMPTMSFINAILVQYQNCGPAERNPREKDGVLKMISLLSEEILGEESPVMEHMENFLLMHVIPELNSSHGFLRMRACEVLRNFGDLDFKNQETLISAFQRVLMCMKDPEMPVRVSASLAIPPFLRIEVIHNSIKLHAHDIMQELLNLTNEIDMDTLTHVMEQLVSEFSEELMPFAVKLGSQLKDTFLRIMAENNLDSEDINFDEAESKIMAAMGVLKTLSSLIMSVEASKTILAELEMTISPAIIFVLQNNVMDLLEETFEIIELCTYCSKSVSPIMWKIFDLIFHSLGSDAFEYVEEISPTLDNFLSFGSDVIRGSLEYQGRYIKVIDCILTADADYIGDTDRVRAFQLMEGMMLNLKPNIDSHIPWFIHHASLVLGDQLKSKNAPVKVYALEVVINAFYYNPMLTFSHLEQKNATGPFFDMWFKNIEHFTRVHDKKLSILTICNLLEIPIASLPVSLQNNWIHLFQSLLKFFETYGDALEEREREKRIQEGEGENDDDQEETEDENSHSLVSHNASDLDDECPDEDEEYLDYLEGKAEARDLSDDEDDDDNWSLDLMMEEDIYFTTILDNLDAYNRFEDVMNHLSVMPDLYSHLNKSLNPSQKALVESLIVKSREIKTKQ